MPHRVTTTDKEEALRTGKIYLDKEFYIHIGGLRERKYRACKNCGVMLRYIRSEHNNRIDYCMECSPSSGYGMLNRNKIKTSNEVRFKKDEI